MYLSVVVVIFIVLGSGIYAYWTLMKAKSEKKTDGSPTTKTQETANATSPSIPVTPVLGAPVMIVPSDWPVYTDTDHTYSFQYPPDYISESFPDKRVQINMCDKSGECLPYFSMQVHSDFDTNNTNDWFQKKKLIAKIDDYTSDTAKFGALSIEFISPKNKEAYLSTYAIIPQGTTAYVFTFPKGYSPSIDEATMRQVVASFKLL